jgi:hypothetical protein
MIEDRRVHSPPRIPTALPNVPTKTNAVVRSSCLNLSAVERISPRSIAVAIMPRVHGTRLLADRANVVILRVEWVLGRSTEEG